MNIEKVLKDNGEIKFNYKGRYYFLSCYWRKNFLQKKNVEYWLIGHLEDSQEKQIFDSIDALLDVNIKGEKLKTILNSINISD